MLRHPRIHAPGLLYHLRARKNNGQAVYLERTDHASFPQALQVARERSPFRYSFPNSVVEWANTN